MKFSFINNANSITMTYISKLTISILKVNSEEKVNNIIKREEIKLPIKSLFVGRSACFKNQKNAKTADELLAQRYPRLSPSQKIQNQSLKQSSINSNKDKLKNEKEKAL